MKLRMLVLILASIISVARAAETMPDELVGEWVTSKTEFRGAYLEKGQVIYIDKDGIGAVIGGPPRIGFKILTTYDPASRLVGVTAVDGGKSRFIGNFVYDPEKHTLTDRNTAGEAGKYMRRADRLPVEALRELGKLPER